MFHGVLFDLDGTLLNTSEGILASTRHALEAGGITHPHDLDFLRPYLGEGIAKLMALAAPHLSPDECLPFAKLGFAHYVQTGDQHTEAYAHAEPLISWLNQQNIPWGIVTNKYRYLMQAVIHLVPFHSTAKVIICADDLPVKKPDPTPLLHAANQLKSPPKHTLYIGDTAIDMQAAQAAKMTAIWAAYGFCSEKTLSHPYDGKINHLLELKSWLT